jgi:hypothetical protein
MTICSLSGLRTAKGLFGEIVRQRHMKAFEEICYSRWPT